MNNEQSTEPTDREHSDYSIAAITHEANRVWCLHNGDESQPLWGDAPEWQQDSAVAGVQFIRENLGAPAHASHDNWMRQKREAGWVYGETKDAEAKTHPCMVPFDELPPEQQFKDVLFTTIVEAAIAGGG